MSNPKGPDRDDTPKRQAFDPDEPGAALDADAEAAEERTVDPDADAQATDVQHQPAADSEPATEVFTTRDEDDQSEKKPPVQRPERRYTAPGFDAGDTKVIGTSPDPATEVFRTHNRPTDRPPPNMPPPRAARPQLIPPRFNPKLPGSQRSWGWVLALILIILALTAIAVLGTVLLTDGKKHKASPEDQVRDTIHNFDVAVQKGDLNTLRSITCGATRDDYVKYDEQAWAETYRRVSAARQYPVVASIDQVVVNGEHAEANVTAFLAYAPQVRSARSFDLRLHDDQWKICQAPVN